MILVAFDLLRAGVFRRHDAQGGNRLGEQFVAGAEKLRDAEVEQLRFALRRHEDVRRFQVAMNDQVLMRIGDRRADLAEELQALGRGQRMRVAVGVNRFAVHVLHDEIRQSVIGRSAVDQARDVRMIELRQNLPFIAKPAEDVVGIEPSPNELDRNLLAIFVVRARRQINCAQTAPANFADDLVSAELPASERLLHRFRKQIARNLESRLLDEAARFVRPIREGILFRRGELHRRHIPSRGEPRVAFGSRSTAASNSSLTRAQRSPAGCIVVPSHDFPPQPRFRHSPFAFHRARRSIQHLADFFIRQATEEAQFDDLALARIEREEIFQRIVERDQINTPFRGRRERFVESKLVPAAPALFRAMGSGIVDEDATHDLRGDAEEVGAILPGGGALVDQPQIGFVDKAGRLQRVIRAFSLQISAGELAQFFVDQRHQAGGGFANRLCSNRSASG